MYKQLMVAAIFLALAGCSTPAPNVTPAETETAEAPPEATEAVTSAPVESVTLTGFPVLPEVSDHAREIYQAGVAQGHNPQVFSKVGNCMTASPDYLAPFSTGTYDLGEYQSLQATLDYFQAVIVSEADGKKLDSFSNPSQAAASGFTSAGPLDPIWANPNFCESGETPLACEYRVSNPAFALILFGTNDVYYVDAANFETYMREIIEESVKENVLPVLITFPTLPDQLEKTDQFNQIVARLSVEYDVPLVNLWLALKDKPGYGVSPEHFTELTTPEDGCAVCFTEAHLETGIATENLVMLQALDVLRQELSN